MSDIALLPIAEMANRFRDGSLTPTEVVAAQLARIENAEAKLGAFEIVLAERATAAAEAATTALRAGHRIGPFHGVPFALKDLVDVEGLVTTGGTNARADAIASTTATIARRLIAGGVILIGKTKTVEVAYGAWGTNTQRGTPWNPWDPKTKRTPGGSSSGSGVAVASGLAGCAVGTDTGGSVRIPAAWCGIVGLKVTEGALPLDGIVPLSHTLDTPGPMARTVEDATLMFLTLLGRHPVEIDRERDDRHGLFGSLDQGVAGLTLGVMAEAERSLMDASVLADYDAALDRLRALGARVVPFELPITAEDMRNGVGTIISTEGYFHHGNLYETPSNAMDNDVKPRILAGRDVSARDYIAVRQKMAENRNRMLDQMVGIAAYLTPTVATPPIPIEDADQRTTPAGLTRAINYLGFCAASVPMGLAGANLPTSLQVAARGGDEATALRIAAAFEKDRGPFPAPPMAAM
jgi:aspartyl-tRNA(Asn)/glutamyl-tRNA(Gln) amidotransferase subunit A